MKTKFKYLVLAILAVVVLFTGINCNAVVYGIEQGIGQLKIVYYARPVEKALVDPAVPDSIKQKLLLVQDIRRFAFDSLGIKDSKNYTTVYDQKGKPVLLVITACKPYEFVPKEWEFPFLGKFSYKGFFNFEKAEREEAKLRAEGWDTELGSVSGWSTLGWFRDPILSGMLRRSPGHLASLIIHELTHGTLYVPNNVDFNENLATFVGDEGAKIFLGYRFGESSKQYLDFINAKSDDEKYSAYILNGFQKLDSLYATLSTAPLPEKEFQKRRMIREIIAGIEFLDLYNPERFRVERSDSLVNNTYFMSYKRYYQKQNVFEEEFRTKFNSNFKNYLDYLKKTYPSL